MNLLEGVYPQPVLSAKLHQAHTRKEGFAELECECLESDKPGYNLVHFLRIELEAEHL